MSVCNHWIGLLDWTAGLDSIIVKHGVTRNAQHAKRKAGSIKVEDQCMRWSYAYYYAYGVYSVDVMARPSSSIVLDSSSKIKSECSVLSSPVKVVKSLVLASVYIYCVE